MSVARSQGHMYGAQYSLLFKLLVHGLKITKREKPGANGFSGKIRCMHAHEFSALRLLKSSAMGFARIAGGCC
jgi:hypothetical protein